jgi:hypothetical protein
MPDALHDDGRGARCQLVERRITLRPTACPGAYFHELVIGERPIELVHDAVSQAGVSEQNQGVQGMGEAAKMLLLLFR